MSVQAIKAHLAKVGEEPVLQKQKEKQDEANEKIKSLDFSALDPSVIKADIDKAIDEVTKQVDIGIEKAKELAPQLESFTEKIMQTINDPSLLDDLQGLADNLGIAPPGIGLPNLGGGLDIGASPIGGVDIASALSVADVKLGEVGVNGFDSVLPDISLDGSTGINGGGAGALGIEIPGGLPDSFGPGIEEAFGSTDNVPTNLTEVGSGALENPFKAYGNIQIKNVFDSDGNPKKEIFKKGVPATVSRIDSKAESPPPEMNLTIPTDQTTFNLPKIFESFETGGGSAFGGGIEIDKVLTDLNTKKEPETAEQRGARLFGTMQSGTGEESKAIAGGPIGGTDPRARAAATRGGNNRTDVFYAKTPEPEGDREQLPAFADAMLESLGAFD